MNQENHVSAFDKVLGKIDWDKAESGLVPAVVQHAETGTVLMMAWMDREALNRTFLSGHVTFYSRSRQTLWIKGESSGNYLEFVSMTVDCDGDTLLVMARPTGPVCHTGMETCFGNDRRISLAFLPELQAIIESRQDADPQSSYTARLLNGPLHRIAQKVGEEGVETILAATSRDDDALIDEAADLVYHLLVLLTAKQRNIDDVLQRLVERHTKV